jgi:hypothetical protein
VRVAFLVALCACGPGLAPRNRDALANASGDAAAIERLLRESVVNGGLWFDDASCAAQFGTPGELGPDKFREFARCLAGLHLQRSAREDELGDVVVMTYAPGFEIEARVTQETRGPHLMWIGFESRRADEAITPTVTVDALEAWRLAGTRDGPVDPRSAKDLELDPTHDSHAAFAWLKVCVDASGAVTVRPHETTSVNAQTVFVAATRTWAFRPFMIRDRAIPVCAMMRLAYPPGQAPRVETIPLPPPPSRTTRPPLVLARGSKHALVEGKRIAGVKNIVPDDETKSEIAASRVRRVTGAFRVCLDDTGRVESVLPTRSTGFAAYDRKLLAGIWQWAYSPYLVDNTPVPVCTGVTFIYNQH